MFKLSSILTFLIFLTFLTSSLFTLSTFASDKEDIAQILTKSETPDGVVFEVIGSNGDYLTKALEKIQNYKKQLQTKFPKIDIAVVSHGSEQFALTSENAKKFKKAHSSVKRLVASDVPVYICETHASWRDVSAEEFPNYISVASQGPAQIKQYQELGYTLVVID
jgi:intracellular sulfur oxidation DsrE/DsrF family protein